MITISAKGTTKYDEIIKGRKYLLKYPCSNEVCYPYKVSLLPGKYLIECWGASGSSSPSDYSRGAFTSGIISFHHFQTLFFYLGNNGRLNGPQTFNGGGSGSSTGYSGGGATDVRLVEGNYDSFDSLVSRIMVSSGGGGLNQYSSQEMIFENVSGHGHGGSIQGISGGIQIQKSYAYNKNITVSQGGGQKKGGLSGYCAKDPCSYINQFPKYGTFGKGENSRSDYGTGGGGGYFGGGSGAVNDYIVGSGAGGSSFVSGCDKCIAVSPFSTSINNITFLQSCVHFSKFKFSSIIMKDGYQTIKEPNNITSQGHIGSGCALITFLSDSNYRACSSKFLNNSLFFMSINLLLAFIS